MTKMFYIYKIDELISCKGQCCQFFVFLTVFLLEKFSRLIQQKTLCFRAFYIVSNKKPLKISKKLTTLPKEPLTHFQEEFSFSTPNSNFSDSRANRKISLSLLQAKQSKKVTSKPHQKHTFSVYSMLLIKVGTPRLPPSLLSPTTTR